MVKENRFLNLCKTEITMKNKKKKLKKEEAKNPLHREYG